MVLNRTPWLSSYPEGIPHTIDPKLYENIPQMFDKTCDKYGERTSFVSLGSSITFKLLKEKTDALAAYMQNTLGVKPGDRLALLLPNMFQYPMSVFAGLKCGMQIININPLYTSHEILGVLRDCKASVIIAFEANIPELLKISDQTYLKHIIAASLGDIHPFLKGAVINFTARYIKKIIKPYDKARVIPFTKCIAEGRKLTLNQHNADFDEIAFLQYTGGTTGKPKGAMLSHGNIISNIAQARTFLQPILHEGEEVILTALPLYHIFAMTINLMFAFSLGAKNILIIDPRKFEALIKVLQKTPDLTIVTGVNTLFNAFVNYEVFKRCNLSNLRLAVSGGSSVQPGVAKRFMRASGGIPILEGYGLTECSPLCCVNPYTYKRYNASIGLPTPSTLARIVDVDTGEEIWDLNKDGELEFKGPQVMKGYFDNEKETENVMHDGWIKTGDIAVWKEGGYIRIIDRLKDMILVSGFNVFPNEIENVVSQNERVLECAVIGIPSKTTGESVKLFVVKKDPSLTADELKTYLRDYLTGYKMPKHIEFVEKLPKSPVGKVMRRFLKQNRLNG